jgi:hypothetical protein
MKTFTTLKSLTDLRSDGVQVTEASAPEIPKPSPQPDDSSGEDFREMMRRRYTTPFVSAIPYHRCGINE